MAVAGEKKARLEAEAKQIEEVCVRACVLRDVWVHCLPRRYRPLSFPPLLFSQPLPSSLAALVSHTLILTPPCTHTTLLSGRKGCKEGSKEGSRRVQEGGRGEGMCEGVSAQSAQRVRVNLLYRLRTQTYTH